jgi:hypothetical protein
MHRSACRGLLLLSLVSSCLDEPGQRSQAKAASPRAPDARVVSFVDVPATSPHHDAILWAVQQGYLTVCRSSPPAFCPRDLIARDQLAVSLIRMKHDTYSFTQTAESTEANMRWADEYIRKHDQLLSPGCGARVRCPSAAMLRENWAAFLLRLAKSRNSPAAR